MNVCLQCSECLGQLQTKLVQEQYACVYLTTINLNYTASSDSWDITLTFKCRKLFCSGLYSASYREVPSSNLSQESANMNWVFHGFPRPLKGNFETVP